MGRLYWWYKAHNICTQCRKLLAMGTIKEIAKEMGITVETVRYMTSPAHRKRCKGHNHREVFLVE
ncbi:MAG: hypothetical protein E7201_00855 [Selenomonas ruminantium]|uniref:Uncharacterized protein n=1 Tax=Selenomonas ruminantium TaxID=971 RepID=A0A927WL91_SELRU|nr:hypothetical protein [Selenomonas ruminantium]